MKSKKPTQQNLSCNQNWSMFSQWTTSLSKFLKKRGNPTSIKILGRGTNYHFFFQIYPKHLQRNQDLRATIHINCLIPDPDVIDKQEEIAFSQTICYIHKEKEHLPRHNASASTGEGGGVADKRKHIFLIVLEELVRIRRITYMYLIVNVQTNF